MPPPQSSQKPSGQASISSFFRPKTSLSNISSSANPPQNHRRPSNELAVEPPSKRPKLPDHGESRKATLDRMGRWRYVRPSTDDVAAVDAHEDVSSSSQRSVEQERRHERFKEKLLGSGFTVDRRANNGVEIENDAGPSSARSDSVDLPIIIDDDSDEADEGAEERDASAATQAPKSNRFGRFAASDSHASAKDQLSSSSAKGRSKAKGKDAADPDIVYTPLEKQILELKAAHPGVLLIIEVGYKLKFYGEDARIAAKELNIMCFPERNLYTAMIPVHRLHIHVKKLIAAGHKVGVVRQIETRALKAASKNAYTPFVRKLTALYTASTWVDDLSATDDMGASLGEYTNRPKALMALVEQSEGGNGPEDRVSIGIISVEVSTGNVTFDQFSDGYSRSELETRLAHLSPAEVLVPPKLTKPTEKVVSHLLGGGAEGGARIERLSSKPDYNQAFEAVTKFYRDSITSDEPAGVTSGHEAQDDPPSKDRASKILSLVLSLPHLSLIALAQIIKHLQSFNLESICTLSTNFQSFSSRTTMLLNSNTLANLEIFRSTDGYTEKGSLIWLLDKCRTGMGRRMLRKWVSKPLTDIVALEQRLDAVDALIEGKSYVLRSLPNLLQGLPDLERGLARMTYGRITPTELATVLLSLNRVTQEYKIAEQNSWGIKSSLLEEHIVNLAAGKAAVQRYLNQISIKEARANRKADMFVDVDKYPALQSTKDNISIIEADLREHLRVVRKQLHRPSLEYVSVAGIDYLVEVRVADAKKVPADWLRISATKSMVRFHTPEVLRMTKLRDQLKETLDAEANAAFQDFVTEICREEYLALRNVVTSLAVLDVLLALAKLGANTGYTRPQFTKSEGRDPNVTPEIEVKGMRHPILEVINEAPYIPNDIILSSSESKAILLTGCNMGGKSSVVRTLGLLVILAQIGSYVPATSAKLGVHDGVFVRMGARDSMFSGKSTFMVEVSETAEIMKSITPRSLVILDELGRGTSTYDGLCIAQGVLEYILQLPQSPNTIFITHYFGLGELEAKYTSQKIRNFHMAFTETSSKRDDEGRGREIEFLYKLKRGIASKSFGIHCARLAGLDQEILSNATRISEQLEKQHNCAKTNRMRRNVIKLFSSSTLSVEDMETFNRITAI